MIRRLAVLALLAAPAAGQEYSFSVPETTMDVDVRPDASLRIAYDFHFANQVGAHPIDIVDVGAPTTGYHSMSASIDGAPVLMIQTSTQLPIGFEVHLGDGSIAPGGQGTLHVEFEVPDLVFSDTTDNALASLRLTPTWFGSEYVVGEGRTRLAIHLPEGVNPDEALHQSVPFTNKALFENRTVVLWEWPEPATRERMVGVSFPRRAMARVVEVTRWQVLQQWLDASPGIKLGLIVGNVVLLAMVFLALTGGTGGCLLVLFELVLLAVVGSTPAIGLVLLPFQVVLLVLTFRRLRRRKGKYLPAIAEVEGGGIKRGLTAPQAAVLLELPLAKVLMLAIFGLLKKGVLIRDDQPDLQVVLDPAYLPPAGADAAAHRRAAAQTKGTVIHDYEGPILDVLAAGSGKPVAALDFTAAMKGLIETTAKRMKGFDLDETQAYYKSILARAVGEAQRIGEIAQRQAFLDQNVDWILMDPAAPQVLSSRNPTYWPTWRSGIPRTSGPRPAPSAPASGPKFGDVAASFAGWTESSMGRLASAISPLSAPTSKGGFVDLSGLDKVTKSVFEAMNSGSSGGGGGGGGSCACACAGCACACACAGGGR